LGWADKPAATVVGKHRGHSIQDVCPSHNQYVGAPCLSLARASPHRQGAQTPLMPAPSSWQPPRSSWQPHLLVAGCACHNKQHTTARTTHWCNISQVGALCCVHAYSHYAQEPRQVVATAALDCGVLQLTLSTGTLAAIAPLPDAGTRVCKGHDAARDLVQGGLYMHYTVVTRKGRQPLNHSKQRDGSTPNAVSNHSTCLCEVPQLV
jgi:hypothetical protein